MGKKRDRVGMNRTPREELKRLVYVTAACLEGNGNRPTVASITRQLRYSPSTYFRKLLEEMVSEKTLIRYEELHWNGRRCFVYLIPQTPLEIAIELEKSREAKNV